MTSIPGIFRAMNRARVRYVLIGGYASVVHGILRTTVDIDLALDPAPNNVRAAVRSLRPSLVALAEALGRDVSRVRKDLLVLERLDLVGLSKSGNRLRVRPLRERRCYIEAMHYL